MKKFSNISGTKVTSEPKIEKNTDLDGLNEFKYSIIGLMNQFLRIQSYGSARKNILPTVKITGQELFAEALLSMLDETTIKNQIKALEKLKAKNKDWESIDESINDLNQKFQKNKDIKSLNNHINKIKSLLESYSDDSENFDFIVETYCQKIKSYNTAYQRAVAAKVMIEDPKFNDYSREQLTKISEKFLQRAKELNS